MTPNFVFQILREYAEQKSYHIDYASEYAEPGYDDPKCGIIAFANWNSQGHYSRKVNEWIKDDDTMPRIARIFEKLGIAVEWEDEWARCDNCYKAIRTQPDSYGWTRHYWQDECEIVCNDCVVENPEPFLEWLEGCPDRANTLDINLSDHGYVKLEGDYESGLHHGQNDDPHAIAKSLRKMGVEKFIFNLDDVGQFDARFSVWVHEDEMDKIEDWNDAEKKTAPGMSPAEICERGLREASVLMSQMPPGEGPVVIKVGEVTTARRVSPEEFVSGHALD